MRPVAVAAVLATFAGGAGLLAATATGGASGYVSEAGVPGAPNAGLYRASVLVVALALGLLAISTWDRSPVRWAAFALATAAPLAATSAIATCSPGCPLPPYEEPTAGDLLHAGSAIAGIGLSAVAMLLCAWFARPRVALAARIGAVVAVPLLGAAALAVGGLGRGAASAVLERLGLVAAFGWLLGVAVAQAVTSSQVATGPGSAVKS